MDDAVRPTLPEGHGERVEDEPAAQVGGHRPADDPAAERIEHHREIEEAGPGRDVGDVRHPEAVGLLSNKVALDQIGRRAGARPARCRAHPQAPADAGKAGRTHEAGDALAADTPSLGAQLGMHARRPVSPAGRRGVDRPDAL